MIEINKDTDKPYYLNVLPCQFTKGKTDRVLELIKISLQNSININQLNNYENHKSDKYDIHTIDIIVTNYNLQETEQWKSRANKKFADFENFRVDILSSGQESNFKNIQEYSDILENANSVKDLPNILIVCFHSKRQKDIINLIKRFFSKYRRQFLSEIEKETEINFNIYLDEPDANPTITKKYIEDTKDFVDYGKIKRFIFITATPVKEFWDLLNKNDIGQLLNMNKLFDKDNIIDFESEKQNYRQFDEHNIIEYNDDTNNPLEYILNVYNEIIKHDDKRKIIFAPGHSYTHKDKVGSHKEIEKFFNILKYVVFVFNGKFKGFKYPDGSEITLDKYQEENNIQKGELRDTLRHWNKNNKNLNLAITGYMCIERGVTFNTNDFNFTHCIISKYHLSSTARLIQLVGRTNGAKKFVDIMNIITTTEIIKIIQNYNAKMSEICSLNPECFNSNDFSNKNNTIPVKVIFKDLKLHEELILLYKKATKNNRQKIHNLLIKGINKKNIDIIDKNNINKFNINERILKSVRIFKNGDKDTSRRYYTFEKNHNICKAMSQKGSSEEYTIDICKDEYKIGNYTNTIDIAWITYRTM